MSNLGYMEKLLDGVEVERLALGDIGEFIRGNGIQKKDFVEAGFPAVHYGQIFTRYGFSAVQAFTFISEGLAKKSRIAQKNDLLIATTSENDEDVLKSVAWLGEKAAISGDMMLFRHGQNVKYLAYYFQTEDFQKQKIKFITGAKVRRVSRDSLAKMMVSLPSLEVQAEIVRILDAFTELTAELTAELVARKQQYSYYRDQLLTFKEGKVEWKTLNEVCSSISAGGDLPENFIKGQTDPTEELPYPIFANATGDKGLYGFTDKYKIESDAVTISARGAKVGYHTVREGKFTPIIRLISLVPNKKIISTRYLNYILDMTLIAGTKGGIPQLTVPTVKKISIPVPPLAEQERIVGILDKFDTLTTLLTEGLPREIALRQQQYEYYRELLLSFPKAEVADHD